MKGRTIELMLHIYERIGIRRAQDDPSGDIEILDELIIEDLVFTDEEDNFYLTDEGEEKVKKFLRKEER